MPVFEFHLARNVDSSGPLGELFFLRQAEGVPAPLPRVVPLVLERGVPRRGDYVQFVGNESGHDRTRANWGVYFPVASGQRCFTQSEGVDVPV